MKQPINPPNDPCAFAVFAMDPQVALDLALNFIVEHGLSPAFCDYVEKYEKDGEDDDLVSAN